MRLTLRTMLAYLDDILDPSDAERLGQKIQDSEFASGLVHRIRSTAGRQKMGVPPVDGKGIGQDANSVAEYLDNVMPPARVPEMEKVCLESDIHLSEVAACHQILTIVLGEAAQVSHPLRERAYLIGAPDSDRVGISASGSNGGLEDDFGPLAPPVEAPPHEEQLKGIKAAVTAQPKSKPVPEYLRVGKTTPWKPLAITLLVAFALSAVALRAMGPFDGTHPMMRLFGGSESVAVADSSDPAGDPSGGQGSSPMPATDTPSAETGSVQPPAPPADNSSADIAGTTATAGTAAAGEAQAAPADSVPPENMPPIGTPATGLPATATAGDPSDPLSGPSDAGTPEANPQFPPTAPSGASVGLPPSTPVPAPAPAPVEEMPPAPVVEVGFVQPVDRHFVVKSDPSSGDWYRLPSRAQFRSGDQLLVLPAFRPEIQLMPAVQVAFAGASRVEPLPPTPDGEPGLRVEYGRMFLATAGIVGAKVHVDLNGFRGIVTFSDATSEVGIEVRQYLPPGLHPEHDVLQRVIGIYPTVGRIEWQVEAAAVGIPLNAGQVRVIVDEHAETLAVTELPAWIRRDELRDVDRLASDALEPLIVEGRPISLSLRERAEDRKSEVRSLASRCLAYLDQFDPLVAELSDDRQRAFWVSDVDVLMASVARSPDSAAGVRIAMEKAHAEDATDLYRLLWGFSPRQLEDGSASHLVDLLDHQSMNVRILAFENLRRITGQTQLYRPETTDVRRKSSVIRWREQQSQGAIVYEMPPAPYRL